MQKHCVSAAESSKLNLNTSFKVHSAKLHVHIEPNYSSHRAQYPFYSASSESMAKSVFRVEGSEGK